MIEQGTITWLALLNSCYVLKELNFPGCSQGPRLLSASLFILKSTGWVSCVGLDLLVNMVIVCLMQIHNRLLLLLLILIVI